METITQRLAGIINTPKRYEIVIDIFDNFEELMLPLKRRFFDTIKKGVQDKFRLDKNEWLFSYQNDEHFCLFRRSWQVDKSDRGIYSIILSNNDGSGIVRNNNNHRPKNLADEEHAIINILNSYKGMHSFRQGDWWWLLYKENPFSWGAQDYKKICDPESYSFKALVEECVERMEDLLTFMKEKNLDKAIDEAVKLRKQNNKI
jgi:hypothetical protein